jgi:hypothetical protein
MTARVPPSMCPACGYACDAATSLEDRDAVPEPGDWTVCLACGELLVFSPLMVLQKPEPGAIAAMRLAEPGKLGALRKVQMAQKASVGDAILRRLRGRGGNA